MNGASVVGRVTSNMLVSKIGPFNVITPGVYVVSILTLCSLGVGETPGVMIFAALYGFFSGSCELYLNGLDFGNTTNPPQMRAGCLPW